MTPWIQKGSLELSKQKVRIKTNRGNRLFFHFFPLAVFCVLVVIGSSSRASAAGSSPLIQQGDLNYLGVFRVPQGTFGDHSTFSYGGTALAYNPVRNSLYAVGHAWYQESAEISIPQIINSNNINNLATATLLQPFTDATEGKLNSINPSDPNSKDVGGHLVYGGQLYVTGWSYYDCGGTQTKSHFIRPLDLSVKGQVAGPYPVGNQYPGFVSSYMTPIPAEWQSALGGPALTGGCCHSIISLQSLGPAASVFNPSDVGVKNPATPVVGYPIDHPTLGTWGGNGTANPIYNMSTGINGIVFPEGTRTLLFFSKTGLGKPCYGAGTSDSSLDGQPVPGESGVIYCYDPNDGSKGCHAYPYSAYVWAYDVDDLIAVKNGQKNQWEIRPYTTWTMTFPVGGGYSISGAAYDPVTHRIYLAQYCSDGNCYPLIHVFSINSAPPTPDTQPPSSPKNLRVR